MKKFNKTVLEKGYQAKDLNKSILELYPDVEGEFMFSHTLTKTIKIIIGPITGSNGNTITEIEVYNSQNKKIPYTIPDAHTYSSFWTSSSTWGKPNLYDDNLDYTSNGEGSYSTCIFQYYQPEGTIADLTIKAEEPIKKVIIYAGSPEHRIPEYITLKDLKTNKIIKTYTSDQIPDHPVPLEFNF